MATVLVTRRLPDGGLDPLGDGVLLPFLVERPLDARHVIGLERRHVVLHLDAEGADLVDQVLVRQPHVLRHLVHPHLLVGQAVFVGPTRHAISGRLHHL